MYRAGQIVEEGDFDHTRLPTGYHVQNGRVTRIVKSSRPEACPPEVWAMMSGKQKQRFLADQGKDASDESGPKGPADTSASSSSACAATLGPVSVLPCFGMGFPSMPTHDGPTVHREKLPTELPMSGWAAVARSVNRKEVATTPEAQAAMKKEWDALRALRTWEENKVREWQEIRQ